MPIDVGIYANLLRPPKSVAEYDQEAQASQLNALQLQQGRMKADEYTRGIADQNALRDAYKRFGSDETANANALYGVGQGKAAQDYLAKIADIKKTTSAASKDDIQAKGYALDQSIKAHDFQVQKLAAVNNPQDAAMWAQDALKNGIFTPEQYQRGVQALQQAAQSPQTFEQWKQQALQGGQTATETLKQQQQLLIANNQNATSRANNADTNATHIKTTGMSNAVTMRGQNLVDARTRESTAATMTKPFEVTGPDGTPVLVQQDKQGNITPVQGYAPKSGAQKPLNEGQSKALGFGTRMQEADKILAGVAGQYSPAALNAKIGAENMPGIGAIAGPIGNAMLSDKGQQAEQAQRDFINAVLRRESGAAISPTEFDNARKQYFDQPNDGAPVKAQKAANRKLAMEGVLAEVPKGYRGSIDPKPAAGAHPPEISDLLKKYGGK